jgi:DHA1 family multidrug resistance protein-like MFS transporter
MTDLIREAPLGQTIRFLTRNAFFKYPEEQPGFEIPRHYVSQHTSEKLVSASAPNDTMSLEGTSERDEESLTVGRTKSRAETAPYSNERVQIEQQSAIQRTMTIPITPAKTADGITLVDWYTTDGPANPQNWSRAKKAWVTFVMCFYTWVVYTGASIIAPCEAGIMAEFNVGYTKAVLSLAIYVLAYGIGPLLFAPLTEIPIIGRNPVYFITFVLFFALSFPTSVVTNYAGLLVLRFLQGFFGSPALANAGATFSDIYSLLYVPYALSWWVFAAGAGPALGPLMAGSLSLLRTGAGLSGNSSGWLHLPF